MQMRLRFTISLLLLLLGMIGGISVSAEGPAPNTPEDNACYDGGTLENSCVTMEDWVCGWHLARVSENDPLPAECNRYAPLVSYPLGDRNENACNEGGSMAGQCESVWAWQCGWYVAQWVNAGGWSGNYPIPSECSIGLPPVHVKSSITSPGSPPVQAQYPSAGCVSYHSGNYVNFYGGWALSTSYPLFTNANCTNEYADSILGPVLGSGRLVYAPAPYDANQLCQEAFGSNAASNYGLVYSCH